MPVRRPSRVWPTDNAWVMISILNTLLWGNALKFSFLGGMKCACTSQRLKSWTSPITFTLFFRRGLQLTLEIDDSARLAGQQALPQVSDFPVVGLQTCTNAPGCRVGAGG